jgi:hypothetical protein
MAAMLMGKSRIYITGRNAGKNITNPYTLSSYFTP